MRVAGALVLAGVVGFLLGACGGSGGTGSALTTRTGLTVTRTQPTVERPTAPATTHTVPTTTVATTTVQVTTTTPPPATTRPPLTVTVVPPPATTEPAATTTAPPAVAAPPTTTAAAVEPASSSDTPWGWIALVLALTALAIAGVVLWSRHRSRSASWSAHYADLRGRTLVALDDVVAQGSVVAGQVEALAGEARDLERHASGEQATAIVAPLRSALDELAEALEADRTLRLATPAPSSEQLAYSDALIRQQVTQLQGVLRSP